MCQLLEECPNGLSTSEALEGLYHIIYSHRKSTPSGWNSVNNLALWKTVFHHSNRTTLFFGVHILIFLLIVGIFIYLGMWVEGAIVLFFIVLNTSLVVWDNYLLNNELNSRIDYVLKKLNQICTSNSWSDEYFPHPCTPNAPSVSLQWTIRDGKIINLPTVLLTAGDLIVMRPGQQSPVDCCIAQLNDDDTMNEKCNSLMTDEVFSCHGSLYKLEQPNEPTTRQPLPNKIYKVIIPPIATHLNTLRSKYLNRPVSSYNDGRHIIFDIILCRLLPITFFVAEAIALFRWLLIGQEKSWKYNFLVEPSAIIISLLPLAFPVVWFLMNSFGNALLLCSSVHYELGGVVYNTESVEVQFKKSEIKFSFRRMMNLAYDIMFGKGATLTRSSNLLHTLASVTNLCCVDKKGILSWPNPTAEKLFILSDIPEPACSSKSRRSVIAADSVNFQYIQNSSENNKDGEMPVYTEILDLTHDNMSAWKLHFDDVHWRRHMSSLKPLGLAVLLNTCNSRTHEQYCQFCAHITCQSLFTEHLVPVSNRRCLCELSRLIGFRESADQEYDLELQLSTYKNVGDIIEMDTKYMKNFFKRRQLKFPFPHMVSVTVNNRNQKEEENKNPEEEDYSDRHLFSQGTADIILDCCVDCWNGSDVVRLTPTIRHKILEFYQRSSLSAYCTAFSYRPVFRKVDRNFADVYIELPREIKGLSSSYSSYSQISVQDSNVMDTDMDVIIEEVPEVVTDVTDCFKAQCNQIFIGMVSMQYQALTDMVQLIEELEKACIRFIHFSKENELRSRVFSEKMGIESGWNCHISLLGDCNRRGAFSESLACFQPLMRNRTNVGFTSNSNNSFHCPPPSVLSYSDEDSPHSYANPDNGCTSTSEKRRKSVDQSSDSDGSTENEPLGFDMSNRSKLPRGIENIRPHLKDVDNVPLLVSLFTDCTPEATQEMISIMQENGEIVCVIGSSANVHNNGIFIQANASIGLDPLYPQVCQREPVIKEFASDKEPMAPIQLSQLLNSLACCVTLRREDPLPIYHLILQSRHIMQRIWNCVEFWLCCIAALTVVQLIASVLRFPAMFTIEQVLWISCVAIPLFSVSLLSGSVDDQIMEKPSGKDMLESPQLVEYLVWCYGFKIIVSVLSTTHLYESILTTLCNQMSPDVIPQNITGNNVQCFSTDMESDPIASDEHAHILFLARQSAAFILILHYTALCGSFLHRQCVFWKKIPCLNVTFVLLVLSVLIIQFLYIIDYEVYTTHLANVTIPVHLLIYSILSPLLTFLICELIKLREIRLNKRHQRKVRLMFGTKLGMNSPF